MTCRCEQEGERERVWRVRKYPVESGSRQFGFGIFACVCVGICRVLCRGAASIRAHAHTQADIHLLERDSNFDMSIIALFGPALMYARLCKTISVHTRPGIFANI